MSLPTTKYVSITTFRRTGTPVATPVWWAPLGDGRWAFTVASDSGKAKRLAHTQRVTVVACDARGRIQPGAVPVETRARYVADGPELARIKAAVTARYGLVARITAVGGHLRRLAKRNRVHTAGVIVEPVA